MVTLTIMPFEFVKVCSIMELKSSGFTRVSDQDDDNRYALPIHGLPLLGCLTGVVRIVL